MEIIYNVCSPERAFHSSYASYMDHKVPAWTLEGGENSGVAARLA